MNDKESIKKKILELKENKWLKQISLVKKYKVNLISYKFNIPSWPKSSLAIIKAFNNSLSDFQKYLIINSIPFDLSSVEETELGPTAIIITKYSAEKLKELTIIFEENYPIGRLLDIDVMNQKGVYLDREIKRKCLLCVDLSIDCMQLKKHDPIEVRKFFDKQIQQFNTTNY